MDNVMVKKVGEQMRALSPLDQTNGVSILLSFMDPPLKVGNHREQEPGNDC